MTVVQGTSDAILKVPEVAQYLRVSPSKLYAMIKRGEFPCVKVGGSVRIRRSQLEAYLAEQSRS